MRCPFCGHDQTQVRDSRAVEENAGIRRRRSCSSCQARFTTMERTQLLHLTVEKKNGDVEPFDRAKLARAMGHSLSKRAVEPSQLERVINGIVRQLESLGESKIATATIGEMVMEALSALDPVAYIRFASIYKDFSNPRDFEEFVSHVNPHSLATPTDDDIE